MADTDLVDALMAVVGCTATCGECRKVAEDAAGIARKHIAAEGDKVVEDWISRDGHFGDAGELIGSLAQAGILTDWKRVPE